MTDPLAEVIETIERRRARKLVESTEEAMEPITDDEARQCPGAHVWATEPGCCQCRRCGRLAIDIVDGLLDERERLLAVVEAARKDRDQPCQCGDCLDVEAREAEPDVLGDALAAYDAALVAPQEATR